MTRFKPGRAVAGLSVALLLLTFGSAQAATRWWDGGTTDIGTAGNGASAGGAGTWNTTIKNWDQGSGLPHVAWNNANSDTAVFGGTVGMVTLGTGITVGGLNFITSNYLLTSNTVTFDTSGSISNAAAATIASVLTGNSDAAISKDGSGTLVLSGTNTYSGNTLINAGTVQFNSAAAIGGSGRSVTVAGGAAVAPRYAIGNAFLNRLAENANAFTIALAAGTGNALDFSGSTGANLPNASLGSYGAITYSGTLTPNGSDYRLGGGAGTLTITPSMLTGDRNLVVTGPSQTVVLSGTGNTFTGDVTVNSGTLQLNSAGAFNSLSRAVAVNSGATLTFNAANAAQAASVTLDAGATVNFNVANAATGGTFAVSGTANAAVTDSITGAIFTLNTSGLLVAANGLAGVYSDIPIHLNGGTLRFNSYPLPANSATPTDHTIGGNLLVTADSIHNSYNSQSGRQLTRLLYGTLDFAAADPVTNPNGYQLDVIDTGSSGYQPAKTTTVYVGSTISHSGMVRVRRTTSESQTHFVELNNTAIRAGQKLTLTQVGGGIALLSGSLGVALLGGAELLGSDSFTMVDASGCGSSGFSDTSTFDYTEVLWVNSNPDGLSIVATLANSVGLIADGGSATFASANAACVSLTGLAVGNNYKLTLTLANAADQATVLAQLAKNPTFTNIAAAAADQVALQFTAPVETSYFAWDNVHSSAANWYLGGNLAGVALSLAANITAPTILSSGPLTGTSFPLTFSGPDGQTYHVLTSTNVALPLASWTVLTTGTFGVSPVTYTDTSATNAHQFYRIVSP